MLLKYEGKKQIILFIERRKIIFCAYSSIVLEQCRRYMQCKRKESW